MVVITFTRQDNFVPATFQTSESLAEMKNQLATLKRTLRLTTLPVSLDGAWIDLLDEDRLLNFPHGLPLLKELRSSLNAMTAAAQKTTTPVMAGEGVIVPGHNYEVASWIKPRYSMGEICELEKFLTSKDVFKMPVDAESGPLLPADRDDRQEVTEYFGLTESTLATDDNARVHASLAFVTLRPFAQTTSVVEDAKENYRLLAVLEESLVRDNGMIRRAPFTYEDRDGRRLSCDSYLSGNYWLLSSLAATVKAHTLKSSVTSPPDTVQNLTRGSLLHANSEAEWCLVSVMSEGYSLQAKRLLQSGIHGAEVTKLVDTGISKANEYLNRALARITGAHATTSNGLPCPAFVVPEAYEYVSSISMPSQMVALPGAHTPSAWAACSLSKALTGLKELLALDAMLRG